MHEPMRKRAWVAQRNWNSKMHTLLKGDGGIKVHEAPDYSLKALEAWAVKQSVTKRTSEGDPNLWWRQMHALLQKEPKSMRGFSFMPKGEVL